MLNHEPTRSAEYWFPDLELHVSTKMNCPLEKWLSDKHINAANMSQDAIYTRQTTILLFGP